MKQPLRSCAIVLGAATTLFACVTSELDEDGIDEAGEPEPDPESDTGPEPGGVEGDDTDPAAALVAPSLPAGCVSVNLKTDAGAKGDGVTNDTSAFQRAAARIKAAGCGQLIIPPATYIVGRQITKTSSTQTGPYYKAEPIFTISGVSFLKISAYGAKIRVASGLRYGGFDPTTGAPMDATSGVNNKAEVGRIIFVSSSNKVWIEGGEYDGNNTRLRLGGQWGNESRQAMATGIGLDKNLDSTVVDVYTHHHGLDGITVAHYGSAPTVKKPQRLVRVISEYNGRQALSWIGGWGLYATDCKFNHTGRAINQGGGVDSGLPLASKPGAGLDIEPNEGSTEISRDGVFTRCEFVNNTGAGLIAAMGDGGYSKFIDSTFWGTTSYSIWADKPGLRFINSRFYGTAMKAHDGRAHGTTTPVPAMATYFENCTFEDKPWTDGKVTRKNNLYTVADTDDSTGATWKNCTFINHAVRGVYMGGINTREIFSGSTFVHSYSNLSSGTYQSQFVGSQLVSVLFDESAAVSNGSRTYYIATTSTTVGTPPSGGDSTYVEGPRVHWDTTSGPLGTIKPGVY
ncbi:MAG TPA: glycosyl hydrolase family 28-related protein [Kofleriaceae bacterium]|jgi:hypothetical protein|nr:glycosyl hydrolase family 28-related protein [Kofleriaceae bacterium]